MIPYLTPVMYSLGYGYKKRLVFMIYNFFILTLFVLLAGCAYPTGNKSNAYVSPNKYMLYDCTMIETEMTMVSARTVDLYNTLQEKSGVDSFSLSGGILEYWSVLFSLKGKGQEAQEYKDLNKEYASLVLAAKQEKCDMKLLPASPKEVLKQTVLKDKQKDPNGSSGQNLIRINPTIEHSNLPVEAWRVGP
ncbi:MAG: hypothetical protein KJP19_03095 [Deltaproteobacteria bacterium]|nr:hypothetical protein [Deltaproteobacteria bacterium]